MGKRCKVWEEKDLLWSIVTSSSLALPHGELRVGYPACVRETPYTDTPSQRSCSYRSAPPATAQTATGGEQQSCLLLLHGHASSLVLGNAPESRAVWSGFLWILMNCWYKTSWQSFPRCQLTTDWWNLKAFSSNTPLKDPEKSSREPGSAPKLP